MKFYFLAPKATIDGVLARNNEPGKRFFSIGFLTHVNDAAIDPAKLLVVVDDPDEAIVDAFVKLPGVEHVGDPWLGDTVKAHHVSHLKHFGVSESDSVLQVVRKASVHWPGFRLRGAV